MPIRPELRKFYGREWREVTRPRILARAGNCCEQCGKPNGSVIYTITNSVVHGPGDVERMMFWVAEGGSVWRDHRGEPRPHEPIRGLPRKVWVILTVAHLNHVPGDDRDENLAALCGWCHLNHDRGHHHETRAARKDAARPLLV